MKWTLLVSLLTLPALPAAAQEDDPGEVRIPLELYQKLVDGTRTLVKPAPVAFALGQAALNLRVTADGPRAAAEVSVRLPIEVFENEWVLVPVLPPGTSLASATVQGNPVQLVATADGLSFGTNAKGSYLMELAYHVDASSSERGYVLAVPVPEASSIRLSALLPGTGLDVSVIPAAAVRSQASGAQTSLQASVPTTRGVQIVWRAPSEKGPSIGRALYRGELVGSSVSWRAELRVELFRNETATVPLLPASLTLTSLSVDGREAPILVEGKRFATLVRGQGTHTITASFETPVVQQDGPPRTELLVPEVPVSRIELVLPGRKDVSASPSAGVVARPRGASTEATVHFPITEKVVLSWSEAVPEAAARELRASASIYHAIQAEEGVLAVRAHVVYQVQHGETSRLELVLPAGVEVNQVTSEAGAVADWRVERRGNRRILSVFLDRKLTSELTLTVEYDRSLAESGPEAIPLLEALGVGRQRGMAALVQTRDLVLNPVEDAGATRVGENQLPAFVRDAIERTIAHTFKYADAPPSLSAEASVPERAAGRFDAAVDTLVSLGDVTVLSSASIEIHVKSGGVDRLELEAPAEASLLNLVAPSLRTHRVADGVVEIEFTQEMEGDFRIEATFERLLGENQSDLDAPLVRVRGADVEQGRIAVEASSAVEVAPLAAEELSPLDVRELPRQLVLRTSHPILHAFRYVRAEPAPRLSLGVTRHPTVAVQEAVIDRAEHRTLVTKDGLAVTSTRLIVRNRRKQFLRLQLPEGSEIWSAFVAGQPQKPAASGSALLIQIVSSTDGFPVELVYATRIPSLSALGKVRARLPRPDLLVTESRWDLYVPEGFEYGTPSTNMKVVAEAGPVDAEALARDAAFVPEPFRIQIPSSGAHYGLEMLYANHGDSHAYLSLPYASRGGVLLGKLLSLAGVLVLFLCLRLAVSRRWKIAAGSIGAVLVLAPVVVYGLSSAPAFVLAAILALVSGRGAMKEAFSRLRASRTAPQNG